MVALVTFSALLLPLIGLGLAGSARVLALRDANRQCGGYW